jgi:hypothetical protein
MEGEVQPGETCSVVEMSIAMRILKVTFWNVEEGSPVVRGVSSICIIARQEVEILFGWSKSRITFGIDFIDPKFLPFIILVVDLEEDLVHDPFREEFMVGAMLAGSEDISGFRP